MTTIILDLEWNTAYYPKQSRFINEIIEFGAVKLDENLEDTIRVTVVATGLGDSKKNETSTDLAAIMSSSSEDEDEAYGDVMSFFKQN